MFGKLKQIKELRDQAKKFQGQLAEEKVEGLGAKGQIKIVMDGNQNVISVSIDDGIMTDKVALEKGMQEAINDAIKKVQKVMAAQMQKMGGLPGLGL